MNPHRPPRAARRLLYVALALTAAAGPAGCERNAPPAATQPAEGRSARSLSAPPAPAEPPEVDLEGIPQGMQQNIVRARQAVAANPDKPSLWRELGCMYFVYNRPQAALTCMQQLTRLTPRKADAWYLLGLAAEKAGNRTVAVRAFEKCIELDPRYPPAYVRLATL